MMFKFGSLMTHHYNNMEQYYNNNIRSFTCACNAIITESDACYYYIEHILDTYIYNTLYKSLKVKH